MNGRHITYRATSLVLISLALITLTGCRKDLCYIHDQHSLTVKTNVVATWERLWERHYAIDWDEAWHSEWPVGYDDFIPQTGKGIRATTYNDGSEPTVYNLPTDGGALPMAEGHHAILFYNNDTEYIVFDETHDLATATASTRTRTRASFAPLHDDERTVTPPDMLYGAYVPDFLAERTLEYVDLPIEMRPLTYSYLIRFRFKGGQQYIAQARGALAGMADKVYLRDGHTDKVKATLLFDCEVDDKGCTALVQSFGAPDFSYTDGYTVDPANHDYTLSLEVQLSNGKRITFPAFDVSEAMREQPRGGVILVTDLEVSDEDGQTGAGTFDPTVDDWEDEIEVPLPLD